MTSSQATLMYQLMRTPEFADALKSVADSRVERAHSAMAAYIDKGDMNGAAIARGEAKAWGEVAQVLDREAQKARPDNS